MKIKSAFAGFAGLAFGTMVSGHLLHAGEPQPRKPATTEVQTRVASGSAVFLLNCALCHGADGRGHGTLADAMKIVPADLTQISKRNNGEFPASKVADIIRNGGAVLGHGSLDMPAWGLYFSEKHNPAHAKQRIDALVNYLRDLQEK